MKQNHRSFSGGVTPAPWPLMRPSLRFHLLSTLALGAALAASPSQARAACCVFNHMAIVSAIGSASTAITTSILTSSQALALQVTSAIKGAQAADAAVQMEAAKQVSDSINRVAAVNRRGQMQEYLNDAASNPCATAASTGMSPGFSGAAPSLQAGGMIGRDIGEANTGSGAGAGAGNAFINRMPGASRSMQLALTASKGGSPGAPVPAAEVVAVAAAVGACETFASGGARARSCTAAGIRPGNSAGLPDADIRADTLFDGPQGATPRKRYSIDLSADSKDRTAVEALVRNLNTPMPLRELSPAELATEKGRQYLAVRDQYEARMSMAERPIRRHIAHVTASTKNIPFVVAALADDKVFVEQFLAEHNPQWRTTGISLDEMLQIDVRRRYMNMDWVTRFAGADPGAIAAEQLRVSAAQNMLMLKLLEEVREKGVAQATANMATIRMELGPPLSAAHRSAAR